MENIEMYQGGDSLNRVHWKLSARKDELLVKELGFFMCASIRAFILQGFSDIKKIYISLGKSRKLIYKYICHLG